MSKKIDKSKEEKKQLPDETNKKPDIENNIIKRNRERLAIAKESIKELDKATKLKEEEKKPVRIQRPLIIGDLVQCKLCGWLYEPRIFDCCPMCNTVEIEAQFKKVE